MRIVGLSLEDEVYKPVNAVSGNNNGIGQSFDYNAWNDSHRYNLSRFTNSLQNEIKGGNISDLMAYNQLAGLQVAAEMPDAQVVGEEGKLSQVRRLSQLEQAALQPNKSLGPFKLLRYEIVNAGSLKTYDSSGQPKIEKMFRLKIEYGYRLIDHKKAYHQNMHDLALNVLQSASDRMMHLGDLRRAWFNDRVYANDLQMEFLSPYRWGGSYNYRDINLRDGKTVYKHNLFYKAADAVFGGTLKGLLVGPRVSLISTKPMTETRVKNLMAILKMQDAYKTLNEEENN